MLLLLVLLHGKRRLLPRSLHRTSELDSSMVLHPLFILLRRLYLPLSSRRWQGWQNR